MLRLGEYVDDWMRLVRRGIESYSTVSEHLRDSREYHRDRCSFSLGDYDSDQSGITVEIPLLWGSF